MASRTRSRSFGGEAVTGGRSIGDIGPRIARTMPDGCRTLLKGSKREIAGIANSRPIERGKILLEGGDRPAPRGGEGDDHSAPGHQRDVVAHAVADAGRLRDRARSAADGGPDRVHPRSAVERRLPTRLP